MHFNFDDEQLQFQSAYDSLLKDKSSPDKVRAVWETGTPIQDLWKSIAELGALGVQAPENAGGSELGEVELALLMETAGYYALPEPFLEHSAVAIPALVSSSNQSAIEKYLSAAVQGEIVITAGHSQSNYVGYGEKADAFLLPLKDKLYLVPKSELELVPQKSLEAPKNPTRINWEELKLTKEFLLTGADAELAFDRGALAAASECVGLAQRLLDMTVEYAKEREQFGKPIGSQQAIKHHLADIAISLEHTRPSVYYAAWSIQNNEPSRARDVSAAKALASEAANIAARKALQCHGAIGYTLESDLSIWLKKAWVVANSWGSANFHLKRVAELIF